MGRYHQGPWMGTEMCPHGQTYGMDLQHRVTWMAVDQSHRNPCHYQCLNTSHLMIDLPPPWCGHARVCVANQIDGLHALDVHLLADHALQRFTHVARNACIVQGQPNELFNNFQGIHKTSVDFGTWLALHQNFQM